MASFVFFSFCPIYLLTSNSPLGKDLDMPDTFIDAALLFLYDEERNECCQMLSTIFRFMRVILSAWWLKVVFGLEWCCRELQPHTPLWVFTFLWKYLFSARWFWNHRNSSADVSSAPLSSWPERQRGRGGFHLILFPRSHHQTYLFSFEPVATMSGFSM